MNYLASHLGEPPLVCPMLVPSPRMHAVYHLLARHHWLDIANEQLPLLLANQSLMSLSITLAVATAPVLQLPSGRSVQPGAAPLREKILELCDRICARQGHPLPPLTVTVWPMDQFEHPAIYRVEALARESSAEAVLYCHGKGASHRPADPAIEQWRAHLNQLIARADHWLGQLLADEAADVAGPCVLDDAKHGTYFAGNFWLAKTSYLSQLGDYRHFLEHPPAGLPKADRHLAEMAINRDGQMRPLSIDGRRYTRADVVGVPG